MSNIAIKVENLSKVYQLGQIGTGTISRDLERWYARVRGKEDPFLRVGESNDQDTKSQSGVVWSLKDINFEIEEGAAVGIIGRNGAGKSTLLKILSKVTAPTTGKISGKGRIASLLEVGTGFHPELSGRENIFLNGAILGMRKKEIQRKLDEIVDFAGIERYLDTPVKRYSSGMYVRLAFAVAAHLESEILIVDEVLAVGDADFQAKCLGKMGEISRGKGKTVLFVSHNMSAVQKLCTNGILLMNGKINHIGKIDQTVNKYLNINNELNSTYCIPTPVDENILGYVSKIIVENKNSEPCNEIMVAQYWQVRIIFKLNKPVEHFIVALGITNNFNVDIRTTWSKECNLNTGTYEAVFSENQLFLASGEYNITVGLSTFERVIHYVDDIAKLNISDVIDLDIHKRILRTTGSGIILNPMAVNITKHV